MQTGVRPTGQDWHKTYKLQQLMVLSDTGTIHTGQVVQQEIIVQGQRVQSTSVVSLWGLQDTRIVHIPIVCTLSNFSFSCLLSPLPACFLLFPAGSLPSPSPACVIPSPPLAPLLLLTYLPTVLCHCWPFSSTYSIHNFSIVSYIHTFKKVYIKAKQAWGATPNLDILILCDTIQHGP